MKNVIDIDAISDAVETTTPTGFARLGLGPAAMQAIATLGYENPTVVQERSIPILIQGRDAITQAPTGTGKTAAYGLPIVQMLDEREQKTQALVVVPTRELAIQVAAALDVLGKNRRMVTLPVYGGQAYGGQLRSLRTGVQVVVGTPGRLLDHLDRGTLILDCVRMVVLDEADEMLKMGFVEDIEKLLAALPEAHQTVLFSATMPPRIKNLAKQYLNNPEHITIAGGSAVGPDVKQVYYEVNWTDKPRALARILEFEKPDSAIVFVKTRKEADVVAEQINRLGLGAQAIHGDISQPDRERVLGRFRAGSIQFLVGTDVAARGLDIPDVSHVINYDLPNNAEAYTHRVGRTGRAGQAGEAITLVTPRERRDFQMIERGINRRLQMLRLPTDADMISRRQNAFRDQIVETIEAGGLESFQSLVSELGQAHDLSLIAAAAFKMASKGRPSAPAPARPEQAMEERTTPDPRPWKRSERESPAPRPAVRPSVHPRPIFLEAAGASTRLMLRVGKKHGVRPADLVGAIANEAGLPSSSIGEISLFDTFSFVDVPQSDAGHVEAMLNKTFIRGHAPKAVVAKPSSYGEKPGFVPKAGYVPKTGFTAKPGFGPKRPSFRDRRPK